MLNVIYFSSDTALIVAVKKNDLGKVELLLENRADLDNENIDG